MWIPTKISVIFSHCACANLHFHTSNTFLSHFCSVHVKQSAKPCLNPLDRMLRKIRKMKKYDSLWKIHVQSSILRENHVLQESNLKLLLFQIFLGFSKQKCKTWECIFLKSNIFSFSSSNCSKMVINQDGNLKLVWECICSY